MTRQAAYQQRMRADHRCLICGAPAATKPKGGFYVDCAEHRLARKARNKQARRRAKLAKVEVEL